MDKLVESGMERKKLEKIYGSKLNLKMKQSRAGAGAVAKTFQPMQIRSISPSQAAPSFEQASTEAKSV